MGWFKHHLDGPWKGTTQAAKTRRNIKRSMSMKYVFFQDIQIHCGNSDDMPLIPQGFMGALHWSKKTLTHFLTLFFSLNAQTKKVRNQVPGCPYYSWRLENIQPSPVELMFHENSSSTQISATTKEWKTSILGTSKRWSPYSFRSFELIVVFYMWAPLKVSLLVPGT